MSLEDAIRKIVREEIERAAPQRDYRGYTPLWHSVGCPLCGIGADGKPMAYVCPRNDCPTKPTAGCP